MQLGTKETKASE